MPNQAQLLATVNRAMKKGATLIGSNYTIYRPVPLSDVSTAPVVTNVMANFSQAYNYNRAPDYDDVLWNTIADATNLLVGDVLVGQYTYFVASKDLFLPLSCVRCTGAVSLLRENSQVTGTGGQAEAQPSQAGGTGRYFGQSRMPQSTTNGVGESSIAKSVPCCMIANAGRATGNGQLPDDAPGPARWRIYLPASVFPEGSIVNRDVLVDQHGRRYDISAVQWTPMGYRAECIRLEM